MTLIKDTIPLIKGKKWAAKWQSENPNKAKAFLIPMEDIIETLTEMNVLQQIPGQASYHLNVNENEGLRAYVGINEDTDPTVGSNEKLLIVGTVLNQETGEHCDIVQDGNYPESGITRVGSGIFDFTLPCPNHCDQGSPLFNPSK